MCIRKSYRKKLVEQGKKIAYEIIGISSKDKV
jgi:hypothetical protein